MILALTHDLGDAAGKRRDVVRASRTTLRTRAANRR
jgi:hypothetical protein